MSKEQLITVSEFMKLLDKVKELENIVGTFEGEKKKDDLKEFLPYSYYAHIPNLNWFTSSPKTLVQKHEALKKEHEQLQKNFLELDHKFDLLERYLQVEYFKIDESTATYDWADKKSNEGFRKTKSYEDVKKEKEKDKEKKNYTSCDCDD